VARARVGARGPVERCPVTGPGPDGGAPGTGGTTGTDPVGDLLRGARLAAGLSQKQVARALEMAQTSISALERGRYRPDEATWARLVDLYGIDDDRAAAIWARVRRARPLRGAAGSAGASGPWPVDPASCSRREWCGQLRSRHGLTRAELAADLGVPERAVTSLERDASPLPAALKPPRVLQRLAVLGGTDEATLRTAWQADEVDGIEHLTGLEGDELVRAAVDAGSLLRWLVATGWTQAEIGTACGVSRPAVNQWLNGRTTPAAGKLAGLAGPLGADASSFAALR
jgi:transcriptional regulator with XRE-family HTH domain